MFGVTLWGDPRQSGWPSPGIPDEPSRADPSGHRDRGWQRAGVCAALRPTDQSLSLDLETGHAGRDEPAPCPAQRSTEYALQRDRQADARFLRAAVARARCERRNIGRDDSVHRRSLRKPADPLEVTSRSFQKTKPVLVWLPTKGARHD